MSALEQFSPVLYHTARQLKEVVHFSSTDSTQDRVCDSSPRSFVPKGLTVRPLLLCPFALAIACRRLAMLTLSIPTCPVILDTTADWDEWVSLMEGFAQARQIRHLVDLTQTEQPPHLTRPMAPILALTSIAPFSTGTNTPASTESTIQDELTQALNAQLVMNAEQRENYNLLYQDYECRLSSFNDECKAVQELTDFILFSVTRQNLIGIELIGTPWVILQSLKRRVAPSTRLREMELSRDWEAQKKAPKKQQIDKWLSHWQYLYRRGMKWNIPEVQGSRAVYAFVLSVKAIDPDWAIPLMIMLEAEQRSRKPFPSLTDIVELYRHHLRLTRP